MVYSLKNVHQDGSMPANRDTVGVSSACKSSKSAEEETTYDSGIVSAELSQTYSSEVDSLYTSSSECGSRPSLRTPPPSSSSTGYISSEIFDSRGKQMGGLSNTDSGVCADVSERLCDIVVDESSAENDTKFKATTKERTSATRDDLLREIFTQDEDGDTQLHLAVIRNDELMVTEILKFIPNADYVNIRNYHWQTCLHLSVFMNSPRITQSLMLAGANLNMEDRNGNTPLHLACKYNNLKCLKALLDSMNAFDHKPLSPRSIDCLNQYNYDGLSCLHLAAEHKDLEILNLLLKYGADVNISECKGGYTLLHEAVESGDLNLVGYILGHPGIDVDRKNYARRTAYQLASRHPSIRQLLLEKGSERFPSEDEDSETDSEESDEEEADYCSVK